MQKIAIIPISEEGSATARLLMSQLRCESISRTDVGKRWNNFDAFIFMVGVQQDYFKVGYSYDVTLPFPC